MIRARNPWWIVIACAIGLSISSGPINIWTFSVFLRPVSQSLHIGRGVLASGMLWTGVVGILCAPFQGFLLDRFGARRVLLVGVLVFAVATAMQAFLTASLVVIYLLFVLRGFGSVGPSPPAFAFVVTRWFDRQRGLAMGVALSGVGLGTAIVPPIAAYLVTHDGWRLAYVGVGIVILILGGVPLLLLVREPDAGERAQLPHLNDAEGTLPGMTLREALTQSWRFWALTLAFFLGIIVLNGTLTSVVPMLVDRGMSLQAATGVLSISGIAAIVGRLLSGVSLDRLHGPSVAVTFFVLLLIGTVLLGTGLRGPVPFIAVMICGIANGAEVDLMGYFVGRYFGVKHYGKIMGTMFGIFVGSTSLGPFISSEAFDLYHSYIPAFRLYEVILVVPIVIFALLGPYRFPALQRRVPVPRREGVRAAG